MGEEDERGELDALENKIKEAGMSKEAEEKCLSELKKLKMMPPMSAESTVVRNYIDTLLELPWKKKSRVSKDIAKADLILNADHYGLEKSKSAFWNIWPFKNVWTSSRARFCVWLVLRG